MEVKSTFSVLTRKLFTFGSLLGFLFLLLFISHSHKVSISNARDSMTQLAPFGNGHPRSTMIKYSAFKSKPELEFKALYSITDPPTNMSTSLEPKHKASKSTIDLVARMNKFESESESEYEYEFKPELKPSYSITNPLTNMTKDLEPKHEDSNSTIEPLARITKGGKFESLNMTIEHQGDLTTNPIEKQSTKTRKKCNIFDGRWVYKEEENPSYNTTVCPFLEEKMSCQQNGRPDAEYEKWRWEAKDCDIPLFNGSDMLERLRNKRIIIVGDSLNRNQWESLACLFYSSIHPSTAIVDAKGPTYKVFKAKDYNVKLEFYWSPFLIKMDESHRSGRKVLILDKLSSMSKQWRGADVMVFNSGHWWTHHGKMKAWDLFEYKGELYEEMPIQLAYDRAMRTWAKWVQTKVNPNKTTVFFRSISAEHKGDQWCYKSTQPILDESYKSLFPKSLVETIERLIGEMNKKARMVKYLNITKLSEYRKDAHPSVYRSWKWKIYTQKYKRLIPSYADCSHWCLPGLPDTWNRLLYSSLFFDIQDNISVF